MSKIKTIRAREILVGIGNPTVETMVTTTDGVVGKSAVPSSITRGSYEAVELRDGDTKR
jgi:enolase